ncbi:MAG: putative nucleotidyltransferase substrate binding domain-containing protein [Lysobacterales bacterium]|nr:cyclic nucleotide-binding/CBS domain-containing protein [Rhodanobacteraceae bacterium]
MTDTAVQVELDTTLPPFDLLPEAARAQLRAAVDLHYLAPGDCLLEAGQPSEKVYVILKGRVQAVQIRAEVEQHFADYGPGDVLGALAVIMGRARYRYVALEDTLCHVIAATEFKALIEAHPRFAAWFHAGLSAKRKLLAEQQAPEELGRLMLTRAGQAQLAPALFVDPATSLAECVRLMRSRHVSCLLVGERGDPAIATRTDILYALALAGAGPDAPVGPLARKPLIAVEAHAVLFQALVRMTRHRVERVVVREEGRILGTLGLTEVLSHYSSHSHLIGMRLERAESIEEIAEAGRGLTELVATLHAQGAKMSYLMELVSALNSRLMARVFEQLLPRELHSKVCLLVLGSEGRSEQLLKTDQDNALILADDLEWPGLEDFAAQFSAALAQLGYPPCPGKVMVNNPKWRLPQQAWRERLIRAADDYDSNAMLELAITVDARPIAGNARLFEPVAEQIHSLGRNDALMRQFAAPALNFHTPLTLFGKVKTDEHGLDIKKGGIFPIVQGLRALALKSGIAETNSFRRAELLVDAGVLHPSDASDVQQALSVFMRLRLGDQLRRLRQGQAIDNHIDVRALRTLDRELLRDALRIVNQFKDSLSERFKLSGL